MKLVRIVVWDVQLVFPPPLFVQLRRRQRASRRMPPTRLSVFRNGGQNAKKGLGPAADYASPAVPNRDRFGSIYRRSGGLDRVGPMPRSGPSRRPVLGKARASCQLLDDDIVPVICPTCQLASQKRKASRRHLPAPLHGVVFDVLRERLRARDRNDLPCPQRDGDVVGREARGVGEHQHVGEGHGHPLPAAGLAPDHRERGCALRCKDVPGE
jgi:hypothetical protein